jgi:hypothetical protein
MTDLAGATALMAPGYQSPTAFSFVSTPFGGGAPEEVNDAAAPATPVPYLIASLVGVASASSLVIHPTVATKPGDAIVVATDSNHPGSSVTDSAGNTYAGQVTSANGGWALQQFIATNTAPVGPGSAITLACPTGYYVNVVIVGIPAAAGAPFMVVDQAARSNFGASTTAKTTVANEIALGFVGYNNGNPVNWPPQWTCLSSQQTNSTGYTMSVAWQSLATCQTVTVVPQFTTGYNLEVTTFMPETRFAAPPSILELPGYQSPANFSYVPSAPQVVNDAPVANSPYLIAQSSEETTLTVTHAVAAGDTIILANYSDGDPTGVTDSSGNVYSTLYNDEFFIAYNAAPVPAGGQIITSGSFEIGPIIVVGIPAVSMPPFTAMDQFATGGTYGSAPATVVATTAAKARTAPEIAIAFSTSGSPTGAVNWPPSWTALTGTQIRSGYWLSAAWAPVPAVAKTSVTLSFSNTGIGTNTDVLLMTFMPETRFALPPVAPLEAPGSLSPALFPYVPSAPQATNENILPGTPYLLGQAVASSGSALSVTMTVTAPSKPGDTVVVFSGVVNGGLVAIGCSDSLGNVYSTTQTLNGNGVRTGQFTTVNPHPLVAGTTITVTYGAGVPRPSIIAVGLPGAYLGQAGGQLIPDVANNATGAATSLSVSTAIPVTGQEIVLAWAGVYELGSINWPPPWNTIGTNASNTSVYSVAWAPLTVRSAQFLHLLFATAPTSSGCAISAYLAETRFAPTAPPDVPPGMAAPGAWQYHPAFLAGSVQPGTAPPIVVQAGALLLFFP